MLYAVYAQKHRIALSKWAELNAKRSCKLRLDGNTGTRVLVGWTLLPVACFWTGKRARPTNLFLNRNYDWST